MGIAAGAGEKSQLPVSPGLMGPAAIQRDKIIGDGLSALDFTDKTQKPAEAEQGPWIARALPMVTLSERISLLDVARLVQSGDQETGGGGCRIGRHGRLQCVQCARAITFSQALGGEARPFIGWASRHLFGGSRRDPQQGQRTRDSACFEFSQQPHGKSHTLKDTATNRPSVQLAGACDQSASGST